MVELRSLLRKRKRKNNANGCHSPYNIIKKVIYKEGEYVKNIYKNI